MPKMDRDTIDKKVRDAAGVLSLTDSLYRCPGQLCCGQRQRVAIGREVVDGEFGVSHNDRNFLTPETDKIYRFGTGGNTVV